MGGDRVDVLDDLVEGDVVVVFSGGDEGGDGFGEIEWVDFVEGQISVLQFVQELGVTSGARTERLKGERVQTLAAQMAQEQSGQKRFAHAGVGPGDEYDSRGHDGKQSRLIDQSRGEL
jgi:hypothetical protein